MLKIPLPLWQGLTEPWLKVEYMWWFWKTQNAATRKWKRRELSLKHFSGNKKSDLEVTIANIREPKWVNWELATKICSRQWMEWVINTCQHYKSPEADGIFSILLQKGQAEATQHVVNLARSSLDGAGIYITKLEEGKVTFIPNIGKEDVANPNPSNILAWHIFYWKQWSK